MWHFNMKMTMDYSAIHYIFDLIPYYNKYEEDYKIMMILLVIIGLNIGLML